MIDAIYIVAIAVWGSGVMASAYIGGRFFPKQTDFFNRDLLFILWPTVIVVSPLFLLMWVIAQCWESGKRDRGEES